MKNIETILTEAGIEITDEQKEAVNKGIAENYKTVNEFTAKVTKLEGERDTYKTQYNDVKTSLGKFDGVDVDALKKQIEDANKKAEEAEKTAAAKLAQRDYDDAVKASTAGTKFSSSAAQRDFTAQLSAKNLPLNDGKLLGFTDFLEQYKKDNPDAIVEGEEGTKAKFTSQQNPSGAPKNPKDIEMERMMRKAMGIPEKKEG